MKVKLKEDLLYSRLTDLCFMDKAGADVNDCEFLYDVINTFMAHGNIVHCNGNLDLYMKANDILELQEPKYPGPDYVCNYHGLFLDFDTNGELEVVI